GGGAVRVRVRERGALDHAVDDLGPAQGLGGEDGASADQAAVGQVREDPQAGGAPGDAGDELRGALRHRVDGVRAHRAAHVDAPADGHVDAAGRGDPAGDVVEAAAARLHEDGVDLVGGGAELLAALEDAGLRGLRIRDVDDLDLRLHGGTRRGGVEAARAVR